MKSIWRDEVDPLALCEDMEQNSVVTEVVENEV
jgi:hypothetical protein